MSINDLIEAEVDVSTFTRKVSKTLGILPINITIGSKTALSTFFCDRLYCKLQYFVREGPNSCQLVCVLLSLSVHIVLER